MDNKYFYQQKLSAEEYDKDRFGGSFGCYLANREVEILSSLIQVHAGKVLDVGAGTGKLSLPLLQSSIDVVSIDSSEAMLRIADEKARGKALHLRAVTGDVHNLCFNDNSFECVICSRALMHFSDWRKGISELCRVARDVVVLDFPPLLSLAGLSGPFRKLKTVFGAKTPGHRVFLFRSIIRELQRNNYRIVSVRKDYFLPVAFHRLLNWPRLSLGIEKVFEVVGLVKLVGAPVTVKAIKNHHGDK